MGRGLLRSKLPPKLSCYLSAESMFSFKHPDAYAQVVSMSEENSDPSDPSGVACNMIEVFFYM